MFDNLLKMFSVDKKAQAGINMLPDVLISIGVVGVIAVTMVIVLLTLGDNTTITSSAEAQGIINDTIDTMEAPFDLLPLFGTILVLVIILGAVFMIYRARR